MSEFYNPQLNSLQTQIQQIQSMLGQKPPAFTAQTASVQVQTQAISFVDGIAGAREYLKKLPANSSAAVFDNAEAVFYTLSTDANGTPAPIKVGRFTLEDAPEPGDNTITKQDLDAFKAEIREFLAGMVPKKTQAKVKEATEE
jgi:hypothetical protein